MMGSNLWDEKGRRLSVYRSRFTEREASQS